MPKQKPITLKLIGLNAGEKQRFEAILSLAEMGLKRSWRLVEQDDANFFILSYRLKEKLTHKIPIARCIFFTQKTIEDSVNLLPVDIHNTPKLRALIELFNQLTEQENTLKPETIIPEPASAITTEPSTTPYFDPQQGFLHYLLANTQDLKCFSLDNHTKLYINFKEQCYFSRNKLNELTTFFTASTEMQCQPLSHNQFTAETHALLAQPLNNLIYYATLTIAQGLPPKQNSPEMIVRLKRWPDLRLSSGQEFIRMATFMQSNATNLATIAERTITPLSIVYNFYNACQLIGLIEYPQVSTPFIKKNNSDNKNLFSQISQRLDELSNE